MTGSPGRPASPYKGLVPYEAEDWPYFFGRDRERSVILANMRSSRLTLLYGPGGQDASTPLSVTSSGTTTGNLNAATSIMSGILSGNSSYSGSSTAELLSGALLTSLQSLSLGG